MAATTAVSMSMPWKYASQRSISTLLTRPIKHKIAPKKPNVGLQVKASLNEKAQLTGLTAATLTASMLIPEVAEADVSRVSPSVENFLLSIIAGGVVLGVIVGAMIGVANFDPVKRS